MLKNNDIMYHGSKHQELKILTGNKYSLLGISNPVVFATPYYELALSMIYGSGKELDIGYEISGNSRVLVVKELQKNIFDKLENPGSVYFLNKSNFLPVKNGMAEEYVSYNNEKILHEKKIDNILRELSSIPNVKLVYKSIRKTYSTMFSKEKEK